jgi:hypothetical protein
MKTPDDTFTVFTPHQLGRALLDFPDDGPITIDVEDSDGRVLLHDMSLLHLILLQKDGQAGAAPVSTARKIVVRMEPDGRNAYIDTGTKRRFLSPS